jgi:hypothetical protein
MAPGRPSTNASPAGTSAQDEPEDLPHPTRGQTLGRSRGGLTTKVHLAADGRGRPLAIVVTPGNVNDSTVFDTVQDAVLDAVRVPRLSAGRPRRRPETVIAAKAYSSRAIRPAGPAGLRRRGIRAVIPERSDQVGNRQRRGSAGGRPPVPRTATMIISQAPLLYFTAVRPENTKGPGVIRGL